MKFVVSALAGASVLAMAAAAAAQPVESAAPQAAAPSSEATLGEIVVTARRRTESLQQVPQTVNAVTADTLQKLNIRQFQDVQSVVPGLSLASSSTGFRSIFTPTVDRYRSEKIEWTKRWTRLVFPVPKRSTMHTFFWII